jgi:hypothetical protein
LAGLRRLIRPGQRDLVVEVAGDLHDEGAEVQPRATALGHHHVQLRIAALARSPFPRRRRAVAE